MADARTVFDMTGKVAVLTGASKGIGEAMARGMAAFGAKVVLSSRKQDAVDSLAASIRDDGGEAIGIAAHTGKSDELQALVDRTVEQYGGIDVLVNNAATNPVFGPSLAVDEAAYDKIMGVNVKGPFELSKSVYPIMRERGGGSIINISSIGGITPEPGLGIYSMSKAALISLTKVLASEWGSEGIRVNAICPGLIQTKFSAALWEDDARLEKTVSGLPLGRIGMPDDLVGLAVFLASDASSYCTGGVFTADGGHTI